MHSTRKGGGSACRPLGIIHNPSSYLFFYNKISEFTDLVSKIVPQSIIRILLSLSILILLGRCNLKHSRRTVDFLQQTITMNENVQWQMIKDSVLFALSSGFSVSFLFEFFFTRGVLFCISSFFSLHRSLYLLLVYFRSRDQSMNHTLVADYLNK